MKGWFTLSGKSITPKVRLQVWNKFGGRCAYCGNPLPFKKMQVDHLFPKRLKHYFKTKESRAKYNLPESLNHIDNLMPSCGRCNHYKRSYLLESFRRVLLTIHKRIQKQYLSKVAADYGVIQYKPWDGVFYFEKFPIRTKRNKKEFV